MLTYLLRLLKRFAVLLPGIAIAYVSARDIFPFLDKRLPIEAAVLLTYILGAYILIPATLRGWRLIVPAKHLPLYCVTPDGFASDPLNIGLVGSRKQLIDAMQTIGWHVAEPYTARNIAFAVVATILGKAYHGAPMSWLYLFGRRQDIAFEQQLPERGHRHHVRFWATTFDNLESIDQKTIHWHNRNEELVSDRLLWVGAASRDIGVAIVRHTLQFTHAVHPDTNTERDILADLLLSKHAASAITTIRLHSPYQLSNRPWARYLRTDGKMAIMRLTHDG